MDIGSAPAISFRTAIIDDLPALRQFEQGIVSAERAFDPTLRTGPVQYYDLKRMLLAENVRFVIAEHGDVRVGCGFARLDEAKPYLSHSRQAYLGLMYVDPNHRGQSIIGGILERLETWCRSQGVMELRLEVYSDNRVAVGAYEKGGFSKHIIEMRRRLEES